MKITNYAENCGEKCGECVNRVEDTLDYVEISIINKINHKVQTTVKRKVFN